MLKFNGLLLAVTISFFSLFLFKTENSRSFQAITHTHDIKIDSLYNAFAISANNSFEELLNFDKQKKPTVYKVFNDFKLENKELLNESLNYLKVCNFLDLNLTTRTIIYPFHSFL
ncbi:hypothetical protein [Yeosuana sp. AK3]